MPVRTAGLFAGIGGIEAGLEAAGHETHFLCESAEPARAVLAAHFQDVPQHCDVRVLAELPQGVELVSAGFPCQDLSQAGRTVGIDGARSGLVNHVFRLLDSQPVPWVLLENVSFMLSLDGGRAMESLVRSFEARGYRWAYRVINSLAFLPQRRERVFFLASKIGVPEDVLLVDEATPEFRETSLETHAHGFYWTEGIRGLGWAADAIPTLKNGSSVGIASPPAILLPAGQIITPDIRDAERLQGFPSDWTAPATVGRRAGSRWSLVGNAVSVPAAHFVGQRLSQPGQYSDARDMLFPDSGRWPRAARGLKGLRKAVEISAFPAWQPREPLHQFLRHPGKPLSMRATSGFLSRTSRSSLRFVPGFLDRVQMHLARSMESPALQPFDIAAE